MQEESKRRLYKACDELFPQLVKTLQEIVSIPSVEGKPALDEPFGNAVAKALRAALQTAESLGFKTDYGSGHVGYAQLGAQADYVAALGHLDVVPEGKGWVHDPYGGIIDEANNCMYGRGVLDNKGPILSCLFAMKAISQAQLPQRHAIRILFGTNEETGFRDIPVYLDKEQPPVAGFTPDCKYPVVYGERGRLKLRLLYHGADQGVFFAFLNSYFLSGDRTGKELHIDCHDQEFGTLQMGGFRMIQEQGCPGFEVSIQYPACCSKIDLLASIRECLIADVELIELLHYAPVRFAKDSRLIHTLQTAYEEVTGMDGTPVTTSGGTYAKVMPNIVPFGPSFPNQKGIAHLPDEWMSLKDLKTNMKIYALALAMLADTAEF